MVGQVQLNVSAVFIYFIYLKINFKVMTAPKGYYRNLISDSNIRIAFTHTPMYGVTRIDSTKVIEELEQSTDEYAKYYINGLKNGQMVTIVENSYSDRYFVPGELYFKS